MKIQDIELDWMGHSCFRIKFKKKIIYIDPFKLNNNDKADIVLITHNHYDHCSFPDIDKISKDGTTVICTPDCVSMINRSAKKLELLPIEPLKEYDFEGINVKAFPAYNKNKAFHQKNEAWVGYLINLGKITIYHAGDTDCIEEMAYIKKNSSGFLVALVPVDGKFSMNYKEAEKACELIKPDQAIPMHYGSVAGTEQDAKNFVELCKENNINAQLLKKS